MINFGLMYTTNKLSLELHCDVDWARGKASREEHKWTYSGPSFDNAWCHGCQRNNQQFALSTPEA